jgi:sulfatase maturation enzyme AslB (radical SAM superfamily)
MSSGLSYRESSNIKLAETLKQLNFQSHEELIENQTYAYFDVRISNLCNLRCVYCNPTESSSIAVEQGAAPVLFSSIQMDNNYLELIKNNLPNIVEMYFCGGEPLMIAENYAILDLIIEQGRNRNIALKYNSNCTQLQLKDKNILDYWKQFDTVTLNASIDSHGDTLSYIRHGSDWQTIYNNLKTIKETCGHVRIKLTSVLTALNVFYLPGLIEILLKNNIVNQEDINLLAVQGSGHHLRSSVLPTQLKQRALALYKDLSIYDFVIKELAQTSTQEDLDKLIDFLRNNDKLRNTNCYETFKELSEIFE